MVAVGVWAYFGVIERLNKLETNSFIRKRHDSRRYKTAQRSPKKIQTLGLNDRYELGQSQSDLEQYMMIEELYKNIDKMQQHLESMADNKIH